MNVLLYAPSLAGHPQVYCRVISRALLDAGHTVIILSPSGKHDWRAQWPPLRPLADEIRVVDVDVRQYVGDLPESLTAEQMAAIQDQHQVDSTLFIEGDKWARQFRRIAAGDASRLRGRVCAICDRASEWYPGEDPYTGKTEPLIAPTIRQTAGRIRRRLFNYSETQGYYYEHVLLRGRVVDALIVKDERIAQRFGAPVFWMPEIHKVFDTTPHERRGADWHQFADPIRAYVARAGADNVLLYFGTGAWYKGYDGFLRLALRDPNSFALHAGAPDRREAGKPYAIDVDAARNQLLHQGRLFETNAFVESMDLVDLVFSSISRFVSTHRLTLSSGTALQALEQGKPVLTPDTGLVGWRTRHFKLGMHYPYGSEDGLLDAWQQFRSGSQDPEAEPLQAFMRPFSRSEVERFFIEILTGGEWVGASNANRREAARRSIP